MPERQALNPDLRLLLDEQAAAAPDPSTLSEAERVTMARAGMPQALAQRDAIPGLPNSVLTRDLTVAHDRPARLYTPAAGQLPRPLLVYLHGGGWVAGSLATHDPFCRLLSQAAEVAILSVDYRQPPEHRFPAALEDAVAAIHWAAAHPDELGIDPHRIAVGGDSAGGNLAAAAANRLASQPNAPGLRGQLLLYPVTDHPSANHPSYQENATGYGLTGDAMRWFWQQYAPDMDPHNPELSPLRHPSLPTSLPPALVTTAEYDVLRDEGLAYADKLRAGGVAVTHLHAPDMHHNFPVSPATVARFPQSLETLNHIAGWLRATLRTPLSAALQRTKP